MIPLSSFLILIIVIFLFFRITYGYYLVYKNNHNETIQAIRKDLKIIYNQYYEDINETPNIDIEDLIIFEGDQSFTYDKKKIYLCLQDDNEKYSYDSILYVAIHELAHVICDEKGHTELFWSINEQLLQIATDKGMYRGSNLPRNYCPLY